MITKISNKIALFPLIFSVLFSSSCVINYPFYISYGYRGPGYYFDEPIRLLYAVIAFLIIGIVSYYLCNYLLNFIDNYNHHKNSSSGSVRLHNNTFTPKHSYLCTFLILLVGYIPYIIASYSGILHVDTLNMFFQTIGTQQLTTHHPLTYSILSSSIFSYFSVLFNDSNLGLFSLSLAQLILVIAVISYGLKIIIDRFGMHLLLYLLVLSYFIFNPRINNYMMLVSKDVPYASFLIIFSYCILNTLVFSNKLSSVFLLLSAILVLLFRNEGLYIVLFCLALMIILSKRYRIRTFITIIICIVVYCGVYLILPDKLSIEKGSGREMLSIPLMQTANYVFSDKDSITAEEEEVILNAFSFESLEDMAANYDPHDSDYIKNQFEYDIFSPDAVAYYKIWIKMGLKRPDIYINTLLAFNYEYYFPLSTFEITPYNWSDDFLFPQSNSVINTNLFYPSNLNGFRTFYENARDTLFSIFPLSIFNTSALYTWSSIFLFLFALHKKSKYSIIIMGPIIAVSIICMISPCNGFFCRYQYPILLYLPFVALYIILSNNFRDKVS